MLVAKRFTGNPETVGPEDYLSKAESKMEQGNFRRLPVVEDGKVVGIITDRDLREHRSDLERTKVGAVMSRNVMTVTPRVTLEKAAQLMLSHKIGGLPVVDDGQLVGVITTSDILQEFLDTLGASEEDSFRIDLVMGEGHDLSLASKIIRDAGAEALGGLGAYRETWDGDRIGYLHVRSKEPNRIANLLEEQGFKILGVHV
jgi:acetoin utilization protein AcuB